MGTVHLAEDEDGERVAVKLLHPHLLERRGFFKRFRREARAGGRVDHPNVVRTLDSDLLVIEGTACCFLVMEYVKGRTLREMLREHSTLPEALVREIARQVAAGLVAIHAAGIVHRDLKPENVLVTDDHRVRIMDLGVARHTELATELTQEGQFAGSLLYAAPEQLRGSKVGPAADLYALGVMLYELLSGTNPFRHDDPAAVITAHLETDPERIDRRTEEVSVFLSELIGTLLAKQPQGRIVDATVLGEVLAEGERSSWWSSRERTILRERERRPQVPVRRETKLYGRETELALCREAWERAKERNGNVLLLEGEAGIGKSRLVDAFVSDLDGAQAHVLYGSYPPSGGMGGISDAILTKFGRADLEESLKPYLTVTPSLAPTFAAVVKREAAPEGVADLRGDALHAVCVHFMRALAEEKPLLWVVEDLHFADSDSRRLLLSLARAVEGHPVLLLATTRPGIPEDELVHFGRLENYRRASLGRLSAREVVLLLEDAFRSEMLADKLGARIARQSDGIPFFIFEMIRGLREGQFITQLPDGSWIESKVIEKIEVPPAVKDLIEARLRDLTREDRAVLDVGSVLGFELDPDLVASVRQLTCVQVLEILGDIERRFGVVRASGDRYRFDHHQIQEVVYGDLSQRLRAEYHTVLAEAHAERRDDGPEGDDAVFIAHHHLRGGRPKDGLPYLIPALDHLDKSCRNEEAIDLAARALDIPKLLEGRNRVRVLLKKASRHRLRGEWETERALLEAARVLGDKSGDAALRAKVRVELGWCLCAASANAAARDHLEKALEWARKTGDTGVEASALGHLGCAFMNQDRYEQARVQFERCVTVARENGHRKPYAGATANLGIILLCQGDYGQARAQFEEALALAREIGNREGEVKITLNLGTAYLNQGHIERARSQFERALALSREIGDRVGETFARSDLGTALLYRGCHEQARVQFERHLALSREVGSRPSEATATGNLGLISLYQGDYGQARAQFEEALTLAREIGNRRLEIGATGNLGMFFYSQGEYARARMQAEKCLALAREIGDRSSEAWGMESLGRAFFRHGLHKQARAQFERCLVLAREIGERQREGWALASLAALANAEGDAKEALRLCSEALALWRDLDAKGKVADTLVALGAMELEQDDHESAVEHLDEALTLAREVKEQGTILLATVHLARLPGGDTGGALASLEEHEQRADHKTKMETRFHLWELTQDKTHLTEAKRLLDFAVEHSPKEYRTSMIDNVPLHRDIMKAWEERGEK